jgi:hypothetical protein
LLYLFEDMAYWLNDTRELKSEYSFANIDSLSGSKLVRGKGSKLGEEERE